MRSRLRGSRSLARLLRRRFRACFGLYGSGVEGRRPTDRVWSEMSIIPVTEGRESGYSRSHPEPGDHIQTP